MRRREFITLVGGAVAWPLPVKAQRQRPLLGWLGGSSAKSATRNHAAFLHGLREHGLVDGKNIEIVYRWADGDEAKLPAMVQQLVALQPNVILSASGPGNVMLMRATSTIPIVGTLVVDPVRLGLADSYNRPGRNFTGVMLTLESLPAKQVELLLRIVPHARSIGVLVNHSNPSNSIMLRDMQAALRDEPIKLIPVEARNPTELDAAFRTIRQAKVDGLVVLTDLVFFTEALRVIAFANAERLPSILGHHEHVGLGGLMSYGVSAPANFRRAAYFIDRILKGDHVGDLPIELPTKVELIVNMKTAKALGLEIAPTILAIADEVIE